MKVLLSILLVSAFVHFGFSAKLPIFIKPCRRIDRRINDCINDVFVKTILPRLGEGIPELFVPPLSPLVLPEVALNTPQGLNTTWTNLKIFGLANVMLEKIEMDLENNHALVRILAPKFDIETDYSLKGTLLGLQLNAQGFAVGNYSDVVAEASVDFKRYTKNGKEYLKIDDLSLTLHLGKPIMRFEKLFGNDIQAGEQANKMINDNMESIIDAARPVVYHVVSEVLYGLTKRFLETYSVDDLFP